MNDQILAFSTEIECKKGDVLFHQHARADRFYILKHGEVDFRGNAASQEVVVGQVYSPGSPIGLHAFHAPHRYEVQAIVSSTKAVLLRWESSEIRKFLSENEDLAKEFYQHINVGTQKLIEESSELFLSLSTKGETMQQGFISSIPKTSYVEQDADDILFFLLQSPFFDQLDEKYLKILAKALSRHQYDAGDVMYAQGDFCDGLDILEAGEIQLSRTKQTNSELNETVWFRSISTPGYLVGCPGLLSQMSDMTARVSKDAVVYHLSNRDIESLEIIHPEFGLLLQQRISWLLLNQFRMVQSRLLSAEFDEEVNVVKNLLENNQAKLGLNSLLHAVPHMLGEKLTLRQGLNMLHQVEKKGSHHERNLATLSLDNLQQTQKEADFYEGLIEIYSSVVGAPAETPADELRKRCNEAVRKTFSVPSINLRGYNNLPSEPGHIFIYNHLLNDPYYTLPNQFQITLDSHYISMLLYERYGMPATRMVRIGMESEYAHEDFYEKLNFINVYTNESRLTDDKDESKLERRQELMAEIEHLLSNGVNLVVSPEGNSYPTDQSPGKFKTGIFRIALQMKVEPLIVPIVVGNFDQRIPNNTLLCEIKEPFKLSSRLTDQSSSGIKKFVKEYQSTYKKYIHELIQSVN